MHINIQISNIHEKLKRKNSRIVHYLVNKQNALSVQWKIIQTLKWMMHRYTLECNEPLKHYVKWKSQINRLIKFHSYEMWCRDKFIAAESRLIVATDCGDNKG